MGSLGALDGGGGGTGLLIGPLTDERLPGSVCMLRCCVRLVASLANDAAVNCCWLRYEPLIEFECVLEGA